jgi:Domain of unknown function (DUF4177)
VGLRTRKTDEQKAAEWRDKAEARKANAEAKDRDRAQEKAATEAAAARQETFIAGIPMWEYQVIWVGKDKQKGMMGSGRMKDMLNREGKRGWELVAINEERATFKRQLPPAR